LKQLSNVNTTIYDSLALSKTERRYVTTTDGKKCWCGLFCHLILMLQKNTNPLYCQGGPQAALTSFSLSVEFPLMAANGYSCSTESSPGQGVEWNEQISKDWGGQ
jgi:dipeptidyl aminopeptidase/acylaminoacyl peptidase